MTGNVASVLQPAGPTSTLIAELSWVLIAGSAVVFLIVMAVLAWALVGNTGRALRGPRQSMALIVGGGVAFPAIVLSALLVYTTIRTTAATKPGVTGTIVNVNGHMWWWQVRYRDPAGGPDIALANEIHMPTNRVVTIGLTSADVIHSFWVPALAGKVDTVPGRVYQLHLEATAPGVYRGECAEFCGVQHTRMAFHVVVHEPAEYERWLTAQSMPAPIPTGAEASAGQAVFVRERCAACHTIRGLTGQAEAGPDLTHVGSRLFLAGGDTRTDAAGFARWVANTQHIKPGALMPEYQRLDAASLGALAAFLAQLK